MTRELPAGLRVQYTHHRETEDDHGIVVLPRGGQTVARLIDEQDREVVRGMAWCHPADNYRKSIGRAISLGRALKELDTGAQDTEAKREAARTLRGEPAYYLVMPGGRRKFHSLVEAEAIASAIGSGEIVAYNASGKVIRSEP